MEHPEGIRGCSGANRYTKTGMVLLSSSVQATTALRGDTEVPGCLEVGSWTQEGRGKIGRLVPGAAALPTFDLQSSQMFLHLYHERLAMALLRSDSRRVDYPIKYMRMTSALIVQPRLVRRRGNFRKMVRRQVHVPSIYWLCNARGRLRRYHIRLAGWVPSFGHLGCWTRLSRQGWVATEP